MNDHLKAQQVLNDSMSKLREMFQTWLQQRQEQVVNLDTYTPEPSQCRKIPICYDDDDDDLIESVLNRDNVMSSPKIGFLLEEFAGELALIAPIPPGIVEADFDPKGDIPFIENLMYDNSFPHPPETLKDDSETVIDSNNDYAVENVVENESHFSLKIVDQDLSSLAMFIKHLMGEQWKRVVMSQWRKRWELRRWIRQALWREMRKCDGFVVDGGRPPSKSRKDGEDGGVENKSSLGSRLIVTGEIVVEWLLEKLVELPMCSPMVERMVDREEKKFLD
ncbi:hypothetical protein Tco_0434477 [Tanacetum coccineum]